MITAYFMAPVRGSAGDSVSDSKKADNVKKGIEIGQTLRGHFPNLDIHVPHEHEDIIDKIWRKLKTIGFANCGRFIVECCCEIAIEKDMGIAYIGDGISEGMSLEMKVMADSGIPVIEVEEINDNAITDISALMTQVADAKKRRSGY